MSQRQVVYESDYIQALGSDRGLVIVFKGEPAVLERSQIRHAGLGHALALGPGVNLSSFPYVKAVAFLRGRGIFAQYTNPNPHYMNWVNMPPIAQFTLAGQEEFDEPQPHKTISLWPGQSRWVNHEDIVACMIRPRAVSTTVTDLQMVQAPNPQALQPIPPDGAIGNSITYNLGSAGGVTSVHYVQTDVGNAIDAYLAWFNPGYGGSYIRVQPQDKLIELNQLMDTLTKRIAPRTPPDKYENITPMSYNDYAYKLRKPSFRHMMLKGGATDLVEYITGTKSKQMMRTIMPLLFTDGSHQRQYGTGNQFAITSTSDYVMGTYIHTHYFEMRDLMRSMSVDHRIRFMSLYAIHKALPQSGYANLSYGNSFDSIKEFMTVGDHTKILNKIEEELRRYEHFIGMTVSSSARVAMDPFQAIEDTGSQLIRWRKNPLNKRQSKMFPNGIVIKKWQTIKEVHDDVSKQANKLETLGQLEHLPWAETVSGLHGQKCGEVSILLPRTNMALVRWGKEQNHCVGSSWHSMKQGHQTLLGIFVGGKITYCIRLSRERVLGRAEGMDRAVIEKGEYVWRLTEFRGKGNCWPSALHSAQVIELLTAHGIDCKGWSESTNGYGREKIDNWDADFAQYRLVKHGIITPVVPVRNFTKGPGPESNNVLGLQL